MTGCLPHTAAIACLLVSTVACASNCESIRTQIEQKLRGSGVPNPVNSYSSRRGDEQTGEGTLKLRPGDQADHLHAGQNEPACQQHSSKTEAG